MNGPDTHYTPGNVGIGITNPAGALDVRGSNLLFGSGTDLQDLGTLTLHEFNIDSLLGIHSSGKGVLTLGWDASADRAVIAADGGTLAPGGVGQDIAFITNAGSVPGGDNLGTLVPKMIIQGDGDVGIGTTDPGAPLHVEGVGTAGLLRLQSTISGDGTKTWLNFFDGTGTRFGYIGYPGVARDFYINNEQNAPIRFFTLNDEKMRIAADGKIGIGTTGPAAKLHINESGTPQPTLFTGTTPGILRLYGGTYAEGGFTNIDFSNAGTGSVIGRIGVKNTGAGSSLVLGTSNDYGAGVTNEAVVIDPSGDVALSGDLYVGGVCFRPAELVRCFLGQHLTWFDNQAECTGALGTVEGTRKILAECEP